MKNNVSDICVFEDNPTGHHLAFVEILIRYIFKKTKKRPVFLSTNEVKRSKQYEIFLKKIESNFKLMNLGDIERGNALSKYQTLVKASHDLEKMGVRVLLNPSGDKLPQIAEMVRVLGILMN